MTEEELEWTKERIREAIIANKLGVSIPWSNEEFDRLGGLWLDKHRNVSFEYTLLYGQIEKELSNERGQ